MMEYNLTSLIDLEEAQALQNNFSRLTGMAAVLCDLQDTVTALSVPTEFAAKLIHDPKLGFSILDSTGISLAENSSDLLISDIFADGKRIGTLRCMRLLSKAPDEELSASLAEEFVMTVGACALELARIKVVSDEDMEAAQSVMNGLAELLSMRAEEKLRRMESASESTGAGAAGQLYDKVQEVRRLVRETNKNNRRLEEAYKRLTASANRSVKCVVETEDTVRKIQDLAMNTRILGFNASIEASRVKENGRGFGVIAQEVRNLAEVSKSSADRMEDIIHSIGVNTEEINDSVKRIGDLLVQNLKTSGEMSDYLAEVSEISSCVK